MSEKTFLIKMEESCFMTSLGWCVCGYGVDKFYKCDGELIDRPEWCPLKELREAKSWDIDNKFVWVEKWALGKKSE